MTTARDNIKDALKKIHVLGVGDTLGGEDASDGFRELNRMLSSWSTEDALIYAETKETFTLTGVESYTIGTGQTFNTTVPRDIKAAYVTYAGLDHYLQIIDAKEYASICDKDLTDIPSQLYFDSNYPTARIYMWPVGYSGMTLTLISEKPLTSFASLDDDFDMPPEYEDAIVYNLAVRRAPDYEREASTEVKRIASNSLKLIKKQNRKNDKGVVATDYPMRRGDFDINSGRYQ